MRWHHYFMSAMLADAKNRPDVEAELRRLGVTLPTPITPLACFVNARIYGNLLYTSGHIPFENGKPIAGRVNLTITEADAKYASRNVGLHLLASIRHALGGDLNRIRRVVKTLGLVNCDSDYKTPHVIINPASELFVELLGEERGKGARSAIGASTLPLGAALEIEMILEIDQPCNCN